MSVRNTCLTPKSVKPTRVSLYHTNFKNKTIKKTKKRKSKDGCRKLES